MDIIHGVYMQSSRAQFPESYMNSNDFAVYSTSFSAYVHDRYDSIWCYLNLTLVLIFTKKISFCPES